MLNKKEKIHVKEHARWKVKKNIIPLFESNATTLMTPNYLHQYSKQRDKRAGKSL